MVEVTALSAFQDNYIWVLASRGSEVVVVDPGQADPVADYLQREGRQLGGILVTHHHPDHIGGVAELASAYNAPVWGPARERIPARTHALVGGNRIRLDCLEGLILEVLDVPGHTAGHVALFGQGMLFSGDTLFAAGCGRLFEGTAAQMRSSLQQLRDLPDETRLYCGHEYTEANLTFAKTVEPDNTAVSDKLADVRSLRADGRRTLPSRISEERATNPFLRWDEQAVIDGASRHAGGALNNADDVFAAVRNWKDNFRA